MSSQFRIFDNIIFYLNLQIPWEVKGKSVNRLAGSQVNKVNPSNNSNNLRGRWDRKKTFVWSVATGPRVTTTTRWLAKAAKAFFGGPSPKTRDMLANILEILVKLTCTWGENAKRAGILLLFVYIFIVLQFRKRKHLSNMNRKTIPRILQNVSLHFLQISLLTYVCLCKKQKYFSKVWSEYGMRKKYVCTEPTQAWLAGSISILHQFFLRWLYSWEWSTSKGFTYPFWMWLHSIADYYCKSKINDLIFLSKKLDQNRMSVIFQMRFFFSNELYLSAAKYEPEVNHSTTIEKAMGFLIKLFAKVF